MMPVALSLNHFLDRGRRLFAESQIVSRLPDKSLKTHSYADYVQRTLQLACALQALGVAKGERVATLCWNHHVHLEAYFGIPAAGAVMHTLNLRLSPDEIGWIAHHADDRVLIVDDILMPLVEQFRHLHAFQTIVVFRFSGAPMKPEWLAAGHLDYDAWIAQYHDQAQSFHPAEHDENDPVAMCYTSGTTGRPKGVVYSHRSTVLHSLVACAPDFWALSGRDVVLPVTPMFHANSWGIPYAAIMLGAKLVFPGPHLHPADLLDLIALEPPTMALGVPTIWMTLIQTMEAQPGRWSLPKGMRSLVGGSAVPEALIRAFARHGVDIAQGWGMTETSPLASMSYIKPELRGLSEDETFRRKALAGVPVPLVEFRLVREREDGSADPATGAEVCAWDNEAVGEIQVRGPFITGSYHAVEPSAEKFTQDGWLRTGDVAAIDSHGYVRIADRTKDLIKSGGEWISSVDLENAIMAHPSVAEAAVIAVPHPRWAERPLACVVVKPDQRFSEPELQAFLGERFAKWQIPDAFVQVPAIPRTSTGKFWKAKLREQFPSWNWGEPQN
jgi:fatty-acyl-CoA synthase